MSNYSRAFYLSELQGFSRWHTCCIDNEEYTKETEIVYLWDDFSVSQSPFYGKNMVLKTFQPDWIEFCVTTLHFQKPETLSYSPDQPRASEHLNETELLHFTEYTALKAQKCLDILQGPLLCGIYFKLDDSLGGRFFFIINHMISDMVSQEIILTDLFKIYRQLEEGQPIKLRPKTTSVKDWAELMVKYAQSDEGRTSINKLLVYRESWQSPANISLSVDYPVFEVFPDDWRNLLSNLGSQDTDILIKLCIKMRIPLLEAFLTALALTFYRWVGTSSLPIHLVYHGRNTPSLPISLHRTAGFFAHAIIDVLDLGNMLNPLAALRHIYLNHQSVPHFNFTNTLINFSPDHYEEERMLHAHFKHLVLFNYFGHISEPMSDKEISGIKTASESLLYKDYNNPLPYHNHFICYVYVYNNEIVLNWNYNLR